MAKIAWVVPVSRVMNNELGGVVLDNPITQLALEAFPNNYSFSISFGLIDLDPNVENKIKFRIGREENDIEYDVLNADLMLENIITPENEDLLKNELVEYDSNINLNNFRFPKAGTYFIELEIDGNTKRINFKVTLKGV